MRRDIYKVVEYAFAQLPLLLAALPHLVVVVVEALPVAAELVEAGLVDVVDDAGGAAGDAAALLQTLELALAGVLGLALHEVIVIGFAPGADEEGGGEERRGCGSDLLDGRDGVRERGGIVENLLVEAGNGVSDDLVRTHIIGARVESRYMPIGMITGIVMIRKFRVKHTLASGPTWLRCGRGSPRYVGSGDFELHFKKWSDSVDTDKSDGWFSKLEFLIGSCHVRLSQWVLWILSKIASATPHSSF